MGLERAGWRAVSFSEIDPYASAVLAERWPGVPNLGDIVALAGSVQRDDERERPDSASESAGRLQSRDGVWRSATLWTGGFPCQDLSVAGKRAGFGGDRSSLAFTFLDLVERYRPPAVLLENVPGLLSSHGGRDMARLLGEMVELGYGVAYRVLDARWFGVPQRRRRVFILGLRSDPDDPAGRVAAERAASVLAVGTRCDRHPPTGIEARPSAAAGTPGSPDGIVGQALSAKWSKQAGGPAGDEYHNLIAGPSPDPPGMRAADGLAGRLDGGVQVDGSELAATLRGFGHGWQGQHMSTNAVVQALDAKRVGPDDHEAQAGHPVAVMGTLPIGDDDPLLPLGLDSHRYRCCGNGVVAPVAEWLGRRLAEALR